MAQRAWTWACVGLIALAACGGDDDDAGGGAGATAGTSSPAAGVGGRPSSGDGGGGAPPAGGRGGGLGGSVGSTPSGNGGGPAAGSGGSTPSGGGGGGADNPNDDRPPPGYASGSCTVPPDALFEDVSKPTTIVGNGTPTSCTAQAFVEAVAKGGVITFNCGADPVTITLDKTAKIFNNKGPKIVIDGAGKVTLSGGDKVRILYQNTCDESLVYTTSHCDDQPDPQLTVQNLTFEHGSSKGMTVDGGGGGAIFVRGGRVKILNSRFFNNSCEDTGPDVGGAAVRVLDQSGDKPVYVVNSTFGGREGLGNVCSNGGGLSSIGVSYTVLNSLFSYNEAIGRGQNPAKPNTPGGGSGGAIYNDGNQFTLTVCGSLIEHNSANEGGGAIFFVSNDRSGSLVIRDSTLRQNPNAGFMTQGYPGIFVLDTDNKPDVTNSTLSP